MPLLTRPALLPPLRLTGATILRDGEMRQRTVAIAQGRITKGPLPAVDLSGCLILPGIVDLSTTALHRPPAASALPAALIALDRRAAACGITTAWLTQGWSWAGGHHSPAAAESLIAALDSCRPQLGTDLHVQIRTQTHLIDEGARLIGLIRTGGARYVMFCNQIERAQSLSRDHPQAFALWAQAQGRSPAQQLAALRAAAERKSEVPRHLCTLAEAFDAHGALYGSHRDPGGDQRAHYSMIGARIAERPLTHAAAAAAKAMGDTVVLAATPLAAPHLAAAANPDRIWTEDLIRAQLCDALISVNDPGAPARAAFALADAGLRDLPKAWALISSRPAAIMRLTDRGTLDHGKRADLVVLDARSRTVEATIAGGRLSYLSPRIASRFHAALRPGHEVAAE